MSAGGVKSFRPRRKPAGRFHHGDLRKALVEAASHVVAREGHESLTLRRVARTVGVTQPAVYRHFASRDALLGAVGVSGYERFTRACIDAALASGHADALAAAEAALRAYVRFASENPRWFRLWFSRKWVDEIARLAPEDNLASRRASVEPLKELLARALPGAPIDDLFRALWGLAHGLASLTVEHVFQLVDTDEERVRAADEAIRITIDSLRARYLGPR